MIAEYETNFTLATTTTKYLTQDHLGSPRVITDQNGAIVSRHDYRAFGEEVYSGTANRSSAQCYGQADGVRKQYTGYERDQESGLDFAQARYYNSKLGRFTSVDPLTASANVKDPQTFNRYSYAMNSPYKFTDPLGLISCPPEIPNCAMTDEEFAKALNPVFVSKPYVRTRIEMADEVDTSTASEILDAISTTGVSAAATLVEDNGITPPADVEHNTAGRVIGHGLAVAQAVGEGIVATGMISGGVAGTAISAPACATGFGCVIPAASTAVSVGGVVVGTHSAALAGNTVNNIFNQASGGDNSSSVGPTCGETFNGLPTDGNGRQLGPSGNPKSTKRTNRLENKLKTLLETRATDRQ